MQLGFNVIKKKKIARIRDLNITFKKMQKAETL